MYRRHVYLQMDTFKVEQCRDYKQIKSCQLVRMYICSALWNVEMEFEHEQSSVIVWQMINQLMRLFVCIISVQRNQKHSRPVRFLAVLENGVLKSGARYINYYESL